jgi:putative FmdB family regulatory protein
MPTYIYGCECGLRFEAMLPYGAAAPACPQCTGATRKIPAGFNVGGKADTGRSQELMPQTWRGTHAGDHEYVGKLRRSWERRQSLEARNPELAGDQRPIIAHEGRYHDAPLRAGDPVPGGPAHSHPHPHPHPHGHGASGSAPSTTGGTDGSTGH